MILHLVRSFRMVLAVSALVMGAVLMPTLFADAAPLKVLGTVDAANWQAYMARFVDPSGRVIDDANGNISHSEGQGYGMILAFAADDRAGFERIWTFTQNNLLLRDDGLAVWSWQPAMPHVPDTNNASDGDILIAYALGLAGDAWADKSYTRAAAGIAKTLAEKAIITDDGVTLLLPAIDGFGREARPDGPVINLSYWIFEALPMMARLAPRGDWKTLSQSGLALIAAARFGKSGLPSEWISVRTRTAQPAAGFDAVFGYNAMRIPLYMMRAGIEDPTLYAPFERAWLGQNSPGPAVVDVLTGAVTAPLAEPGYSMLAAALACVQTNTKIPEPLKAFSPTHYFPSTLQLLALSFIAERHPQCL